MTDEDLAARLRAADPALSLPAAEPERVAGLLEDTMSNDVVTETRADGTHHRSPLTWFVAAAAVVVIVGVGAFVLWDRDTAGNPVPPIGESDDQTVIELTAPAEAAFRCMPPTAKRLSDGAEYAFDGTVSEVDDGVATVEPTRWYAGEQVQLVRIKSPSEDPAALHGMFTFKEGERYLVSSHDGTQVSVCGFSGPYGQQLARLFEKAFGG
ncbi:MAG: hypothetical protein ACRDOM_01430 [Nocardioides sp.]